MGHRLTTRDYEIARFLGRVKIARPGAIARRFGMTSRNAYGRLDVLSEAGLVKSDSMIAVGGAVWWTTQAGLEACRLESLREAKPTTRQAPHDLAMTETVVQLEEAGVVCLTEREIRAFHRETESDRYLVPVHDHIAGKLVRHTPDIVCDLAPKPDRWYAIEVELSRKDALRWRDILTGFQNRLGVDGFGGVVYLADGEARPGHIHRLADETGLDRHFQLQLLENAQPLDALTALIKADRR